MGPPPMLKLDVGANRQEQDQALEESYGSVTLGAADRAALIADLQTDIAPLSFDQQRSRSFGSEPEVVQDADLDTGVRGPANVFQFRDGASYQSVPQELDKSHHIDQPERDGVTGRFSFATKPGLDSHEDSVGRVLVIGRNGDVSSRMAA
jgi:hypothetical protein